MKRIYVAAILLVISGCASQSATLVNEKGEKRYCYKSATGGISNIPAQREFNRCLNEAGAAGFKKVDE